MQLYFIQATYNGNMYKLSDFFTGEEYKLNPSKMLDINFVPDDGITSFTTKHITLPDSTSIREYTHIIIPQFNKIYRITSIDYLNINQYNVILDEDPFIANYQELNDRHIQLAQTNDPSKFLGYNSVQDLAVKTESSIVAMSDDVNATGVWVLFTFQSDVTNLEFEIGEISNYPSVGTFDSYASLIAAFPDVGTSVPSQVPYFLKFANVTSTNELYQAVYSDEGGEGVSWVSVMKSPVLNVSTGIPKETTRYTNGVKIANLGDINTVQVAFPVDATLIQQKTITRSSASTTEYFTVPAFNSIKSWTNSDKLISIKLIPQELLGIETIERNDMKRIVTIVSDGFTFSTTKTVETYISKVIEDGYLLDNGLTDLNDMNLPMYTVRQFKDIFTFDNWKYLIDGPETYEPFKKYYLYFFGEMISIPARYVGNGFKVRLVVTSTGVLYEVYSDHMNIIGSGRLPWDTTYAVDQLELFYASNPTYKDQFNINMFSNLFKSAAGGVIAGAVAGPAGMAAGAAGGVIGGVVDFGLGQWSESLRQKGLRDKADQIFGQNEVALTNIKGFDAYLVIIEPETVAKEQMLNELYMTGWSCSSFVKIDSLPFRSNPVYLQGKLITGRLLSLLRNNYITRYINATLAEGVIILQ